jgi:hypothetical protein
MNSITSPYPYSIVSPFFIVSMLFLLLSYMSFFVCIDWEELLLRLCVRHSKGGHCRPSNGEGKSDGRREDGLYKVFRMREYESLSAPHVGTGFGCYQVDREWLESHPFIYHEDTDDEEEQKAPAPATVVPVPVYQGIFPHILYFLFYLHTLPVPFPQAISLHFTLHICTLILV